MPNTVNTIFIYAKVMQINNKRNKNQNIYLSLHIKNRKSNKRRSATVGIAIKAADNPFISFILHFVGFIDKNLWQTNNLNNFANHFTKF